ncbi:MAG TPA: copper homeostasis protein CutC [Bacteroidales bacterium]
MKNYKIQPHRVLVEVCVDTLASALAAEQGGASRVELCSALSEGGLTPSSGTIRIARILLSISINVMIRPRTGNFLYSEAEFDVMLQDIEVARQNRADGIVGGILLPDGTVDVLRTKEFVKAANPLPVTFHRAFDVATDPYKSLEDIIECGCVRILTSGQKATAPEGSKLIAELVKQAGTRIIIMPGSGINEKNAASLLSATGAHEIHLSGRKPLPFGQRDGKPAEESTGFNTLYQTDAAIIRQVVHSVNSVCFSDEGERV